MMHDVLTLARMLRMVPVVVHSTSEQGGKDCGLTLRYACVKWKDSVLTTYKIMNSSYVFFYETEIIHNRILRFLIPHRIQNPAESDTPGYQIPRGLISPQKFVLFIIRGRVSYPAGSDSVGYHTVGIRSRGVFPVESDWVDDSLGDQIPREISN